MEQEPRLEGWDWEAMRPRDGLFMTALPTVLWDTPGASVHGWGGALGVAIDTTIQRTADSAITELDAALERMGASVRRLVANRRVYCREVTYGRVYTLVVAQPAGSVTRVRSVSFWGPGSSFQKHFRFGGLNQFINTETEMVLEESLAIGRTLGVDTSKLPDALSAAYQAVAQGATSALRGTVPRVAVVLAVAVALLFLFFMVSVGNVRSSLLTFAVIAGAVISLLRTRKGAGRDPYADLR